MPTINNTVTGDENAIEGTSKGGRGVVGKSETNYGIRAHSKTLSGIRSSSEQGVGVEGEGNTNHGVVGGSKTGYGILGHSNKSAGIRGSSDEGRGVEGWATKSEGVVGISTNGNGVWGQTEGAGIGVLGTSKSGVGVNGSSQQGEGVHGETQSPKFAAVAAFMLNPDGVGAGLHAENHGKGVGVFAKGGRLAGLFEGDVEVTGDIRLANADCAEDFDIADAHSIEPGTVMVLGDDESLHPSCYPYDKRVAGVVSGAGEFKPGIVLDKQRTNPNRKPIALLGKVYCKGDAQYGPIEVGDLLTTSPSPGHAMKASDHLKAFGAVIGKALRPLKEGQGLIPILIALQ